MALAADARSGQPATPTHFSNGIPPVSPAPSHTDDLTDRIRNARLLHDRHEQVCVPSFPVTLPSRRIADLSSFLEIQTGLWTLYSSPSTTIRLTLTHRNSPNFSARMRLSSKPSPLSSRTRKKCTKSFWLRMRMSYLSSHRVPSTHPGSSKHSL
jgi:hypothetical protein